MKVNLNKTFVYSNTINCKIAFRGVSLGDFNGSGSFDYANSEVGEDEDVAKKFETKLKNIKNNYALKKMQVTGFF